MYNMIIVDDFNIDRMNIRSCLDWKELGINIIGEGKNGKEALRLCESNQVDIVLTDVQMPFMDGIELAGEISKRFNQMKVVFMSYYNDFEYLKSAIDLNAYGYILKPFLKEEVKKTFQKVVIQWDKDKHLQVLLNESKPLLIQQFYKNILTGVLKEADMIKRRGAFLNQEIEEGYFQCITLHTDEEVYEQAMEIEEAYLQTVKITQALMALKEKHDMPFIAQVDEYHQSVLLYGKTYETMVKESYDFMEALSEDENFKHVQIAVSSIDKGLSKISSLYEQCTIALKYKFHFSKEEVIFFEALAEREDETGELQVKDMVENMRFILNSNKEESVSILLDQFLRVKGILGNEAYYRSVSQTILMSLEVVLMEQGLSIKSIFKESITDLLMQLRECQKAEELNLYVREKLLQARDKLVSRKKQSKAKLVKQVENYVDMHYMRDITVKDVATQFFYSPNYLNTLFRKEMGKSIPDYITGYRMDKAKELLKHEDLKIYEVIEAVGYKRASYFNSIFKRYTGMTPKEFRRSLI